MTDEGSLQKKLPLALKQKDEEEDSQEKQYFFVQIYGGSHQPGYSAAAST